MFILDNAGIYLDVEISGKNPCTTASSIFANLSSCVPVVFHFPVMPLINGASQGLKKTVSPIIEQLRQISQKTAITIFRQQEGILLTDFFQKSCQLKKISKTQIFENSRYSKKKKLDGVYANIYSSDLNDFYTFW